MKLRAARMELLPYERVEVLPPTNLQSQYEKVARGVGLALLFPGTLGVLVTLFAMPSQLGVVPVILACSFLHVLLLLGLLALVSLLQQPMVSVMMRFGWPVHRWWMVRNNPDQLHLASHRQTISRLAPLPLELDLDEGLLKAGSHAVDLKRPFDLYMEWSAEPQPSLRVRLVARGGRGALVFCTPLSWQSYWRWRADLEQLPRLESGGVHLEMHEFRRLLRGLKPFSEASGQRWPNLLGEVLAEAA